MTHIDPRIFRAYDIRGKAHEQLSPEACFLIGQAFGTVLFERTGKNQPALCVGRDARTHGQELEEALVKGLVLAGCRVVLIGETPSPINYFTICTEELDGGIQVTASHNPAEDNGLKLSTKEAEAFSGDHLQELRKRIDAGRLRESTKGSTEIFDAITPYTAYLQSLFESAGEGLHIAVDGGNGIGGPVACAVLEAVGATVTGLFIEPDGRFPNHAADPSKHDTLRDLQATVKEHQLHIGLAFDGDGDRLGIVDETGTIRSADDILLVLARDHLSRFPGAPIVFTVSNSGILQSEIAAWGGQPIMCKVGHSFVEHTMHEHGSLLGGEQSGHFFCGEDYFAFDDALVTALRILTILQKTGKTFSELCHDFPRVHQSQERRPSVADEHKFRIVEEVTHHFGKSEEIITLDGVRIEFEDGAWAGIRASNTSPRISICIEARSPERLLEVEEIVLGHLRKYEEIEWND